MDIRVAILIDGSFFIQRLLFCKRRYYFSQPALTPKQTVQVLTSAVKLHLQNTSNYNYQHLYRVFYYDAPPLDIKAHYPLVMPEDTHRRVIDFSKQDETIYRNQLLNELKRQRKFALRLGAIKHDKQWRIKDDALNHLLNGSLRFEQLGNDDFYYSARQKGVDIKLGIDIATLAQGKLVDKIILIAGDSDFVPAAKLARTHGIDFVLDALHNNIDPNLHEHIDGLISYDLVSILKDVLQQDPDIAPDWWHSGANPKMPKRRKK